MILQKLDYKKKKLLNRIAISPMCQYSSKDGIPTSWHYRHLSNFMISGAGLVMLESTSVSKDGKISEKDLSIETKRQTTEFTKLVKHLKQISSTPVGIQLSHAGRKGSSEVPWRKKNQALRKNSWQTFAPSGIPKDKGWPKPKVMSDRDISTVLKNFSKGIKNSKKADFDFLEIHMAHGYLLHQFLSPISNKRNDKYGGSLSKRFKFPLEVARLARKLWPKNKILGARVTGSDHLKGGITLKECVALCKELKKIGFDYVCVSSGGILTKTNMKIRKFYRSKYAKEIKRQTKLVVGITGLTDDFKLCDKYIKKKYFDQVFIGRPFLRNPFFLYSDKYLKQKKIKVIPEQYLRGF